MPPDHIVRRGHETRDLPPMKLLLIIGGVLAVTGVLMALLWFYLQNLEQTLPREANDPYRVGRSAFERDLPGPELQVAPVQDLNAYRLEQEIRLTTHGWVDRTNAIARIPIEQAMQWMADHGLPPWAEATGQVTALEMIRRKLPPPSNLIAPTEHQGEAP